MFSNRRKVLIGAAASLFVPAAPAIVKARQQLIPLSHAGVSGIGVASPGCGGGTCGNAGGGFNPTSLIGTQGAFWRSDMGVTKTGANVTAVADQGSHGNNLSLPSTPASGNSPQFSATGFNGSFPGISFASASTQGLAAGVGSVGNTAFPFRSTTFSWFTLMFIPTSFASGGRIFDVFTATGGSDFASPSCAFSIDGGPTLDVFSGAQIGNGGSKPSFTANAINSFGIILNGSTGNIYVGFSAQGSGTSISTNIGDATAANNVIGIGNLNNNGSWPDCTMAYTLITNTAMAAGDITNLKSWTNSNWGTSF